MVPLLHRFTASLPPLSPHEIHLVIFSPFYGLETKICVACWLPDQKGLEGARNSEVVGFIIWRILGTSMSVDLSNQQMAP